MSASRVRPPSFAPSNDDKPIQHRAVFSTSAKNLTSYYAGSLDDGPAPMLSQRRRNIDEGLHLIDDLTNRSVDPMFSDSQLVAHQRSAAVVWFNRIVVFIICLAVGFCGTLMVKQLNTDPRKAVRSSLINELQQQNSVLSKNTAEVGDLHAKISKQSENVSHDETNPVFTQDEMSNSTIAVSGPGITLTIADPLSTGSQNSLAIPSEPTTTRVRVVTDADLQAFVCLLWHSGAEAIAINDHRVGVSTSVRTAGSVILVGVDQVSSPYVIKAIGDSKTLANSVNGKAQPKLYASLENAGIHPQIKKERSLGLAAATTNELTYARRRK